MNRVVISVLLLIIFSLSGCGLVDVYLMKPVEESPRDFAESGQEAMRNKEYSKAIVLFTKLKNDFPFSPYTTMAELSLSDAYFLDGKYLLAEEAYKEFESLHPKHEAIPYVLFQIGRSNFEQFRSIDRPLESLTEALQFFLRLQESYPNTPQAVSAVEFITKTRRLMAEQELYVADFYWRSERYGSAWKRYTYVTENFKDVPQVQQYAVTRAELSYLEYQLQLSEAARVEEQGSWRQWFDWL